MHTTNFVRHASACAALTLALGGVANANEGSVGEIGNIDGVAMINQGADYKPAKVGMQLRDRDTLLVMEGGKADLVFQDGCERTMQGPQMLNIGAESACAASSSDIVADAAEASAATMNELERQSTGQLGGTDDQGSDDRPEPYVFDSGALKTRFPFYPFEPQQLVPFGLGVFALGLGSWLAFDNNNDDGGDDLVFSLAGSGRSRGQPPSMSP